MKRFCCECRKDVVLIISEEKMSGRIMGEEYFYTGKIARCSECKNEVYVPEINDYNLEMLYSKRKNKNNEKHT